MIENGWLGIQYIMRCLSRPIFSFFFLSFACQQVVLNGAKAFSLYDIALNSAFAMDWTHYAFFWGKLCAIYHPSTTW